MVNKKIWTTKDTARDQFFTALRNHLGNRRLERNLFTVVLRSLVEIAHGMDISVSCRLNTKKFENVCGNDVEEEVRGFLECEKTKTWYIELLGDLISKGIGKRKRVNEIPEESIKKVVKYILDLHGKEPLSRVSNMTNVSILDVYSIVTSTKYRPLFSLKKTPTRGFFVNGKEAAKEIKENKKERWLERCEKADK